MTSTQAVEHTYVYSGQENHSSDRIALLVSQWHPEITERLYKGAFDLLTENGVEFLLRQNVPGSFELPLAAKWIAETRRFEGIIALGVVIKGETDHDKYINHAISMGCMKVSLKHKIPVTFGVLTVENETQAWDRCGGAHGHKGKEAALATLQMIDLMKATTGI